MNKSQQWYLIGIKHNLAKMCTTDLKPLLESYKYLIEHRDYKSNVNMYLEVITFIELTLFKRIKNTANKGSNELELKEELVKHNKNL